MTILKSLIYVIILGFIFCDANIHTQPEQNKIENPRVIPEHINVGPFFKGLKAIVNAEIPKCAGVIVKLIGKNKEMVLNMKGKKAFIWLNVAQVTVTNAPSIYLLACSNKLDELCSDAEQEKELLGYNSLKGRINYESNKPLSGIESEEFIKFKEHNGNYNINNKAVIKTAPDGKQLLDATLEIPSFITAENYTVKIYCFNEKKLIDKVAVNLSVEEVGLPLFITNLAKNSPATYGILAIIVAMIAGGIIGLTFNKKRVRKN
jgi:uncharacterized protein (TIGR02186 family)